MRARKLANSSDVFPMPWAARGGECGVPWGTLFCVVFLFDLRLTLDLLCNDFTDLPYGSLFLSENC